MRRKAVGRVALGLWLASAGALAGCGAASRAGEGGTTPDPGLAGPSGAEARFAALETEAVPMDPGAVAELPEEAESNVLLRLEASSESPERDPVLGGFALAPPEEWTIGASEGGEEVRVEFLEPEGGEVVMACEPDVELPDEVTVTWIVRYERRNVRLTEEGASEAIHVTPVAARLDAEGRAPMFWISSEAPEPPPE
jgi:hypothetical protein